MTSVGVVVNCYERTCLDALRPGFFTGLVARNRFVLDQVVAVINNADDRAEATERVRARLYAGKRSAR